jgi:pyruvate dehydrogenase E2 component (dihydrolipoamide acetyltransferase)
VVPVAGLVGLVADASVPGSEMDSFVADFQANFVPEEAEEEAAGPAPEAVEVQDRTLRYLRRGEGGEPAVLIHGFGGDLNNWLFNHDALAADRTVYALDLPGHGGSSKHVESGDIGEFTETLAAFLDAIGEPAAHLVGHSLGGAVALNFALAHPGRVLSLVLIAPAGLGSEIDGDYIEGFITAGRRRDVKPHLEKLFVNPSLITRQLIDDILKYKRLDGVDSALRAIADRFFPAGAQAVVLRDRLSKVSKPVLVVWGEKDRILPAAHAQSLPSEVKTHILPGSGHMVQMEAPTEVNRLIAGFWG